MRIHLAPHGRNAAHSRCGVVAALRKWPPSGPVRTVRSAALSLHESCERSHVRRRAERTRGGWSADVELEASDWDVLIVHYLGVDHAGHLGGRHG